MSARQAFFRWKDTTLSSRNVCGESIGSYILHTDLENAQTSIRECYTSPSYSPLSRHISILLQLHCLILNPANSFSCVAFSRDAESGLSTVLVPDPGRVKVPMVYSSSLLPLLLCTRCSATPMSMNCQTADEWNTVDIVCAGLIRRTPLLMQAHTCLDGFPLGAVSVPSYSKGWSENRIPI
ncbi:hypothetical protein BDW22DRAFT_1032687 [Trametopsis cervina]|nr:hypothetical protein BDW22DRAFT_1032687 [Trametopsis cervina]